MLLAAIVFSLAACGGKKGGSEDVSDNAITTAADVTEVFTDANGNTYYNEEDIPTTTHADIEQAEVPDIADITIIREFDDTVYKDMTVVPVILSADSKTVTVALRILNVPNFATCDVYLNYDAKSLILKSVENSKNKEFAIIQANDKNPGALLVAAVVVNNLAIESEDIITAVFEYNADAGTEVEFSVTVKDFTIGENSHVPKKVDTDKVKFTIGENV